MAVQRDNRMEVLTAARAGGWRHQHQSFDGGSLVVDTFTGLAGLVKVVWLRTPWKDSGRFAGAIFSDRMTRTDRNLWTLRGKNSLIARLQAQ